MRPRIIASPASLAIFALMGSSPGVGSCYSGVIFHGLTTTSFEQCGPNAYAFFWFQGRAVQGAIGGAHATTAGNDCRRNQTEVEGMYVDGYNGGKSNGSYDGATDWGNPGVDGCIFNFAEFATGCGRGQDFGLRSPRDPCESWQGPQRQSAPKTSVISNGVARRR
jgi:hypothetical protein